MCCKCNYFLRGMDFMPDIHLLMDIYWMQPFDFGFYSIDKKWFPVAFYYCIWFGFILWYKITTDPLKFIIYD